MMRKVISIILFSIITIVSAKGLDLNSPNGSVKVSVKVSDRVYYSVCREDIPLLEQCHLGLDIKGLSSDKKLKVTSVKSLRISQELNPVTPMKFSKINDLCNAMLIKLSNGLNVEFRAYNDGIAYRIITAAKGDQNGKVKISDEDVTLNLPDDYLLHLQPAKDFTSNYETNYIHLNAKQWKDANQMATLPALIDTKKGFKLLFAETDLTDYPCLFVSANRADGLEGTFSKIALQEKQEGDRFMRITKEADYIAQTSARRTYPWRYFIISKDDRELLESTLPVKLAAKPEIKDTHWIKPGQVSWEWWNAASPYGGDVDFVAGFNLETYKYYIDFASKNKVPYIIMDEGWAESVHDPYLPNKKVDLHELIRYGKEKQVDIILWLTWLTVEKNMDLFKRFADWGIKGVKIDFMDRNDQWMVNYYERVAKEAAKYHILVDFHGSFTPKGLEHKYPNVISYEGVRGMEQMEGCQPENTIFLPFLRNVVGPMDFTPGAMINMQPDVYGGKRPNAASVGTRAYQLALFVLFESGLQMLCDNPTLYYNNKECTDFITQVPVTWDETKALKAEVGEVAVVAKRKGNKWFIGGITNRMERQFSLDLNFLKKDQSYQITSFSDGINAGHQAMDYKKNAQMVSSHSKLQVHLSRNGGYAAVITEME
ncbi:glycoside hydrolase family 97 protein [Pedobacter sp. MC2016-15]|uniref:glycoside hydrolase family 97 protein n=1 Tax=Pedobacter sp. MC2016-15 TaxID=2994473 RepID=UPI0022485607|nr:glycoside hydrolase family 97 protein [Pedobacter sp. MC2016-15]MCX2481545.1 glycoside hydrolase family 97 protein [Pedobacter sp. MC2016-15]